MTITIAPFTVDLSCSRKTTTSWVGKEEHIKKNQPITYWGIYLNDKQISYVSSKELAEKTRLWIEKWLNDRL
jgi:hypothetical protein